MPIQLLKKVKDTVTNIEDHVVMGGENPFPDCGLALSVNAGAYLVGIGEGRLFKFMSDKIFSAAS